MMELSVNSIECPTSFTSKGFNHRLMDGTQLTSRNDFIRQSADKAFGKTYVFQFPDVQNLPTPQKLSLSHDKWKVYDLHILKERLNHSKSKLNTFNLSDWHKHTNFMNPAGLVMYNLRSYNIELLTQAWCKFYEVLNVFPILQKTFDGKLNTFHLCEAPGAFISALNHYLKLNNADIEWKWMANTLNPYYEGNSLEEMINDDRLIFKTLEKWWFGEDYTGNIRSQINLNKLQKISDCLGPIHIVTADGSVDCYRNPAEQEAYVLPLHYAEVYAALSILAEGGSFVLKIFTLFECETVILIYFLLTAFTSVSLHKPVVSKEGNSEVYVVCTGYLGKDKCQNILEALSLESTDKVLLSKEDLPNFVINKIIDCAKFFTEMQINVLEKNIKNYMEKMSFKNVMILKRIRNTVAELFIEKYKISPLPNSSCYLLDKKKMKILNYVPRSEEGTFQEKLEFLYLDKRSLFLKLRETLVSSNEVWGDEIIRWFNLSEKLDMNSWKPIPGKPFVEVKSSKFCKGTFLRVLNELKSYGSSITVQLKEILPGFKDQIVDFTSEEYLICDVTNEDYILSYSQFQRDCSQNLIATLRSLPLHSNLALFGLPLLTQFNVGLAFAIGLSFTQIGFVCPENVGYALIFKDLKDHIFLQKLMDLRDNHFTEDQVPLTLFPLHSLCDEDLYETICFTNHLALRDIGLKKISALLEEKASNPELNAE